MYRNWKILMSVLVINDTRVDRHHGCYAVMATIGTMLERYALGPVCYWPAHAEWRDNADFECALAVARLVVINGEGTIHHNRPAGRRLLDAGMRAREAGVPVALINTGWEANGPDFVAMLDNIDLIAARDSRSAEQMAEGGANVRIVPDLSFWYAHNHAPQPVEGTRSGFGFTDNVNRFKALALERLRRACEGETVAICHGTAGFVGLAGFLREGIGMREDIRHPARLVELLALRHRLWRVSHVETDVFLAQLARLELLVSGRFHACTLALATGTPVIAQSSNTGKIAALFHDVGLEQCRGEVILNTASVQQARTHGWSEAERASLDVYLTGAITAVEQLFADLAKLAAR